MSGIRAGLLSCLALALPAAAGAGETGSARHDGLLESMGASVSAYKDYMLNCGGCHRYDGEGVSRNAVPSFRNSIGLFTRLPEGREYMIRVPGAAQSQLGNAELADVLNWMVANYSPGELAPDFRPFTAGEVGAARPYRFDDVVAARRRLEARLRQLGLTPAPYLYGSN
ncbi:Cytochrome c in methylamine utilization cluster OS=Castellaniella defragrans (strain DSM / CCUG 39792 / 65Phen) OX=1437824 GN=BN940_17486 PE=4 SV=1 [Castellaniella denitrificans]|uniref:cytochrome C n=1 Tax=Castellaniella sp. TaxID=1955812 RepID=UPI003D0ABF95